MNKKLLKLCLITTALALPSPLWAQEERASPTVQSQIFLEKSQREDFQAAIKDSLAASPLIDAESAQVRNLVAQLKSAADLYGGIESWELIREETVGADWVRQIYFVGMKNFPIILYFEYFRSDGSWQMTKFSFDENIGQFAE